MNILIITALFAQLTNPLVTRVFLDADGEYVVFARYYGDELVSIDSVKYLNDYLGEGMRAHNRTMLLRELKKDLVQKGGYASKGLIGTFEIPLPKGGFSDFMGETGKLDVGGHVKITMGGSETFITGLPGDSRTSFFPELEMKQEMAVNLDGQVGDRMRVFIDHNSERINETQNKITVTYKGREDEIIQEIEGGDTQLSIPATTYTGDIPSHRGLFGLKSKAKLGPLDLVAIASKEQTQTQEIEIEGSVQSDTHYIWAKYYERRRFFWLGTYDDIINLEVFVDDKNAQNDIGTITYFGEAYLDTNDNNVPDDTSNLTNYHQGYFTKKSEGFGDYYNFVPGSNIIELAYNLPQDYVLGIWYKKVDAFGDTVVVGQLPNDTDTTVHLKLICPERLDTTSYTLNYEMKNYYQVVSPGSKLDSLKIFYITAGQDKDRQGDVPYIRLLGLDSIPSQGDGIIDENRVFLSSRGLLRFPKAEPFALPVLDDPDPEIYTDPYMQGQGKYRIYVKTTEAKPVYSLPENVERVEVFVDGVLQDSINDYYVDYDERKLEFRKPIPPTSKVRIKVEYAPFFSAAEKSLVGLRGSLRPFGDATLGSSFFYRTESYPAEHIRLKEEPFNRMVWEVDFSYPQDLPFLSRFVDWLPLVETEVPSKLNVNCEGAFSFSNLNARGEVYLDDLESSTVINNEVSISKASWVFCSKPAGKDTMDFASQRLVWYNPRDEERLQASDIYEDPQDPNEIADVLRIVYQPDDVLSYGGLMQYIYSEDFNEVEAFELIIKGSGGKIHVDFAQTLSEDQLRRDKQGNIIGYNTFEDEDKDNNNVWTQQSEDTGLDGIYGDDSSYEPGSGDVGNDDYEQYGYSGAINGTENNRIWDTEDIDRNGMLESENRYYAYSVHLDSSQYLKTDAGLHNGWQLYRVPIKDSTVWDTVINQPDWHDIKYIRIWFDEFSATETLFIYKLSGVGSRWKNRGILPDKTPVFPNESFTLTPVNTKTHPNYKSPYPVERDEFGQVKTEGGLELGLVNIHQGHTCVAHRRTDENEDYRAYDTLTFYFHTKHSNPIISIRLGTDSLNYYEYTSEYEGGEFGYNDYRLFSVAMKEWLDLKSQKQASQDTISDSVYTVVGNPSLSKNQFFEIRIKNQNVTILSDTLWFNDVKLASPKTDVGKIFRGNSTLSMADLASVSFAYDESNGRFRRLSEPKEIANKSASQGYSANAQISVNKVFPQNWGLNIPVTLNYRKSTQKPRFSYQADDIELTGAEQDREKSTTVVRSYTVHVSKAVSKNWLLKNTIDRLSFDHDRAQSFSKAVLSEDTTDVKNYRAAYNLDPKFDLKLLGQVLSPLPKNISIQALYTENIGMSWYRTDVDSQFKPSEYGTQRKKTLNPSLSVTYSPHRIMNSSYSFSQKRDSVFGRYRFGEEVGRNQNFNASLTQDLKLVQPRISFNSSYNEDYRFEIRRDQDLRNVSNSGRYGVDGTVNIKGILKFFTRLRNESQDTALVVGSPSWLAKQIEEFVDLLQNPMVNWSRQRNSSYLNVKVRPEPGYQWGLVDSIPDTLVAEGSYPGRSQTDMYGVSSGMNYKFLTVNGGYNATINRTFNYGGDEVRTNTESYPNLSVRILRLESLPFLTKWVRQSSINTNISQSFEERYEISPDSTALVSDSKGMNFNPLASWQLTWKNGISTNLEVSYSETNSRNYSGLDMIESKMINQGGSASFAYTFSAPRGIGLPLLGGLKFTSNLSLNVSLNYNQSVSYHNNDFRNPTADTKTYGTNVGFSYNFSSSVTGGANFDYSQNSDRNTNQDTKRVSLNIWTNINF